MNAQADPRVEGDIGTLSEGHERCREAESPVQTLLLVGFSRWRVERYFQDQKQAIGLDPWEGRHCLGLKRHPILLPLSYLFLATVHEQLRESRVLLGNLWVKSSEFA